ncbi:MAG: tRNA guanosine(34) transglycosylase Tgt, partial [Candidatus Neomarinimicrobiota bacterium]|nr:tRNA guanosine(34) transglycosylase Tgt [Candidatus Neomarinimicrobiota bacterium]
IGGLAVGESKSERLETVEWMDEFLPKDKPRYLMGVGTLTDLIESVSRGVDMFDCVMPTRNGRNGQIFTSSGTININNEKYKNDHSLIDESSEHAFGRMFTKSYLRHLFNVKEILGLRIASTLNLSYYFSLMKMIQKTINSGDFEKWSSGWLSEMKTKKGM